MSLVWVFLLYRDAPFADHYRPADGAFLFFRGANEA